MEIEVKKELENTVIEVVGRLDATTAPTLDGTINENLNGNIILDFKGLEYISSAGLRVILSAHKKLQQLGGLKLVNVCEEVMGVFEITGFADILTIE